LQHKFITNKSTKQTKSYKNRAKYSVCSKIEIMNEKELKQLRSCLPLKSTGEIAKKVGCSKATASNILRGRISEQSIFTIPVLREAANIIRKNNEAIKEVSNIVSHAS